MSDLSTLPEDKQTELRERRKADTESTAEQWDAAEAWIARSLSLTREGGVVSLVLPDGQPFVVRKASPA